MTKVKNLKKTKTINLIKERNKSQKGSGQQSSLQQSSFLDRLLGLNEMVFMGDPQCNLKDCCFSLQKEQDEESVIRSLQDQNKYLKEELIEVKNKFQEQNKTLNQLGQANRDAIEKLKEYLIKNNIIKLIGRDQNLWNWTDKYLEYIESLKVKFESNRVNKIQIQILTNLENTTPDQNQLIQDIRAKLSKLNDNLYKNSFDEDNLQLIQSNLKEIQQFITKNLKEIAINFDLQKDSELKEYIKKIPNVELKKYLENGKIIQIINQNWKWSDEFNQRITTLNKIVNMKILTDNYTGVDYTGVDFPKDKKKILQLNNNLNNKLYNQKLINAIKPKLKEAIELTTSGNEKQLKKKVSSFLNNNLMQLGLQINKNLQQIKINYHNGTNFSVPNLEDTPVPEGTSHF